MTHQPVAPASRLAVNNLNYGMTQDQHYAAASNLRRAYTEGALEAISAQYPLATTADAYAIQQLQADAWLAAGRRPIGRKVGLTGLAMQRQLGVYQPDSGLLFADACFADGEQVALTRFLQPRVEPEIGIVLKHDLVGPGVTVCDAERAIEFVMPAIEIIDSRISDWRIGIVDTVADNASCGGLVLGSRLSAPQLHDLRLMGCVLTVNGHLAATGAGGAVLGSPLHALVWLANSVAEHGQHLRAGDVILPGSVTPSQSAHAGQCWSARFAGLGSVTIRFAGNLGDNS